MLLSVGAFQNNEGKIKIGLRTRRGLKGATVRNRLKRQLRAIVAKRDLVLRSGLDVVIVIHPPKLPASTDRLETELRILCQRIDATP